MHMSFFCFFLLFKASGISYNKTICFLKKEMTDFIVQVLFDYGCINKEGNHFSIY